MNDATISDIRLGWLQRLSAVAQHGSLTSAGRECNIDPTALSDSIQRLEEALHKPLMAPATARLTVTGMALARRTDRILELSKLSHRALTNVSIGWFQSLIAIAEHETYKKAGQSFGWTRYKVMRGVSELEKWVGGPLVFYSDIVRITKRGEEILPAAREIVNMIDGFCDPNNDLRRNKTKRRTLPWWLRTYGAKSKISRLKR